MDGRGALFREIHKNTWLKRIPTETRKIPVSLKVNKCLLNCGVLSLSKSQALSQFRIIKLRLFHASRNLSDVGWCFVFMMIVRLS